MRLKIELLSDTTFGRGDGVAGLVDTEVEHDEYGMPYLRGRTLKGLLLEEATHILFALGKAGQVKSWNAVAQQIFGISGGLPQAGESILHIGDARLPEEPRKAIIADVKAGLYGPAEVLEALTTIRAQTAMDPSGEPTQGSLRAVRVLLRGTVLEAELQAQRPLSVEERAFLAACVKALRRAGTGRNRGRGRVQVTLWEDGKEITDSAFAHFKEPAPPNSHRPLPSEERHTAPLQTGSKGIALHLKLEEPVLAITMSGDPNSVVSLPFISGSMLRGALIARYLRHNKERHSLDDDPKAAALFFNGTVRYLNAYPADGAQRLLPTPFSWHQEKHDDEGNIYDLRSETLRNELERPLQIRTPFHRWEKGKEVRFYSPRKLLTIHNRRNRVAGRATQDQGSVFRYEAIAPGQTFIAVILGPTDLLAKVIPQEGETLFFGLSRSAGYGKTRVTKVEALPDDWQEGGEAAREIKAGETFSLLLLSDAVLRDARGHLTGFLSPEILESQLGLPLALDNARTFSRSSFVGGFNRKWGMPLPQMWVARAGSVYTFKAESDIPQDKLQALLEQGIGEHRAEGFGRIALWPDQPTPLIQIKEQKKVRNAQSEEWLRGSQLMDIARKPARDDTAYTIARRMLRYRLERKLIRQIQETVQHNSRPISNAQLSAIRALVRQARVSGEIEPIRRRLATMKKQARDQFEQVRIKGQNLKQWLNARLDEAENPAQAWRQFGEGEPPAVWDEDTAREFILRLIDGVLDLFQALGEKGGAA